jgi:cytochrome oxidase Cu insertion factor (SCO1/SenC/PrrC family)
MNRLLLMSLAFLLMVAGILCGLVAFSRTRAVRSGVVAVEKEDGPPFLSVSGQPPSGWMTEYTLTERSGKKFHSRDLAGKVHVVNFFFSKCPTYCRSQTAAVAGIAREFGPQGVVFLSITCDPANDTPAALSLYANEFAADPEQWLFLTGDMLTLQRVGGEMYSLTVGVETHSELLVVVDKWGQIRHRFSWKNAEQIAEMKEFLTRLLAETEPPTA